jgi:hypothetical protein
MRETPAAVAALGGKSGEPHFFFRVGSGIQGRASEFDPSVIMRAGDESRLVNEFGRAFLGRFIPQVPPAKRMDLLLSA